MLVAYLQSLWPEEIYQTWARSYPDDAAYGMTAIDSEPSYADRSSASDEIDADISIIDRLVRALRSAAGVN